MVDAIISTVVEALTSMVLSSIQEEVKLITGVNDEVKKLVSNFKSVQVILDDAEEQQLKEASIKKWLFDLKVVSYDMDDVLDEWKTWIQTSQLQHQHHSSGSNQNNLKHKVLSIFCCISFAMRDVGLRRVVGGRIKEIHQILDDIATDKVRYQLNSTNISDKHIERHVTTSFVDTQKVKGRDEEKDEVKSMILKPKSKLHVISLVGMGGIGKTTLAKLIYNDGEINTHFEKKIWICVSDPFDEMRIAKAILESLSDSSTAHNFKELDNVLKEINAVLNEKRFLLILDDVWNESYNKWEELEQFLTCGSLGSTILVTTRNERVARVMGCNPESIHKVGFLTSEECWSIISQIALVQGDCQKLESIGRRIADKCKGLPLIATTIGGLLRFKKSEKEWLILLGKNEWEGEDALNSLKLSYYDLPLSLKQCFKYCAIFPKDYKISKRRLVGMWMAQGYLKGTEKDEDLEILGGIYFDNLIARSLLQIASYDEDCYVLHDLVNDLAQTFTKNECLMIEVLKDTELNGNSLHTDANVRHLTLTIENDASFPMFIYGLNKLRSLIIQFVRYESSLTVVELEGIFDHLTCLRTLNLRDCDIKEVPSSINRLVHLRWLDLSMNTNLEKLPDTVCECYNLQTLILENCDNLVELPQGIGKLINLMYLDIESCDKINYLPKGIGNLWRLKELIVFIVNMNEDESSSIVEMEKLNNLRGRLEIRGLGNVRELEQAKKAQLMKKTNVTDLRLSFDRDHVLEEEEELLEALEPPSDLEILSIKEYEGKRLFPSWMMKLNLLIVLKLQNCFHCEELPPLGKLPCLEELCLENMGVKRVGIEFMGLEKEKDAPTSFLSFPKLKILRFEKFTEWEEWDDIDEWLTKRINKTITVMQSLQLLQIRFCPKLKTLPYHLLSPPINTRLQELHIVTCDVLQAEVQNDKLSHIPHLRILQESLTIRGLGHAKKLEEAKKAQFLKKKYVIDLSLIFDVDEDEEETVEGDNGMKDEEELLEALEPPPDLEKLSIEKYKGKMFPSWMMKLNLLWKFEIYKCENCEELPPLGKLPCLEELYLRDMRVKRVGAEFMGIEKEKDASTSFLSFPRLKILQFEKFTEWEEWDDIDEWLMEIITIMPYLQELGILNCPKLKTLSPKWMMKLNLLRKLTICKSGNCEELPPLGKLSSLEELYLRDMRVKKVGVEFMGIEKEKDASTCFISFPKLEILEFQLFWEWEEWDDINEWLMETINNKKITVMSSIKVLIIRECPKLRTLPYYLLTPTITPRLQLLKICHCDVLQAEVQKDKLSHISNLRIIEREEEWW